MRSYWFSISWSYLSEQARVPPTRVFLKKRLQAIENKGRESEEIGKEALSYGKQGG